MEEGTKEFYNKQISELYRIIDNYEGIVRDYATLVASMQNKIKSLKGSCATLGEKCENQRKEIVYLHRKIKTLEHKLDSTNKYIQSEYFRNKKYAVTPGGHKIISTYAVINNIRKNELNTRG